MRSGKITVPERPLLSGRIRAHLRNNMVGYLAVFIALTMGTAYASHPGGKETIDSADIIDGEVFSADVANDTLAGGGLAATDLAPNSVNNSEIANQAVTSAKVADGTLSAPDYNIDSVGVAALAANSVGSQEAIDDSLGAVDLGVNSVGTSELGANSVGTSEVATDTLSSSDIGANAVGTSELAQVPGARARATTAQTIANNSSAIVNLSTEEFDTGGLYTAPNDNITISLPGTYMLSGEVGYVADPHGSRLAEIQVNGNPVAVNQTAGTSPYTTRVPVSTIARLGAGNVVTLRAGHNAGNSLATGNYFGLGNAYLAVQWLSD